MLPRLYQLITAAITFKGTVLGRLNVSCAWGRLKGKN